MTYFWRCGFEDSECVACMQRLLGVRMAAFKLTLRCRWAPDGFELFETEENMQSDNPSDGP